MVEFEVEIYDEFPAHMLITMAVVRINDRLYIKVQPDVDTWKYFPVREGAVYEYLNFDEIWVEGETIVEIEPTYSDFY